MENNKERKTERKAMEELELCEDESIHQDAVTKAGENMPDDEILYDLAELFKVFGDSTRIKILYALFEAELCVHDIALVLKMNQSAISHQLRVLKQSRLVRNRREGKQVIYSLADDHVYTIIGQGMSHIEE
ncbi:MAG: ArsR/SmtB family transcription factor [Christensenellales bacterium]|jgi:DNA-binding transcriptional ArsR family regulator